MKLHQGITAGKINNLLSLQVLTGLALSLTSDLDHRSIFIFIQTLKVKKIGYIFLVSFI
jgi:hypothetical protein